MKTRFTPEYHITLRNGDDAFDRDIGDYHDHMDAMAWYARMGSGGLAKLSWRSAELALSNAIGRASR